VTSASISSAYPSAIGLRLSFMIGGQLLAAGRPLVAEDRVALDVFDACEPRIGPLDCERDCGRNARVAAEGGGRCVGEALGGGVSGSRRRRA
jgi:hypothetical protein